MSISFDLLGPLRVRNGPDELTVPARRERILLAMLLLHYGRQVQVASLIDAVWADAPPRDAITQIHGIVYRLRRRLATAEIPPDVIATEGSGYRAVVTAEQVDLWRFRQLRDQARAATESDLTAARAGYRDALDLWRGTAFAGLESAPLRHAATALEEERLQAVEERIRLDLAAGVAGELVAELTDLIGHHPYREMLHGALMTALQRAGRHADALAAFQRLHKLLRDDLGIEPSTELRELHRAILEGGLPNPVPAPPMAGVVPRQLPADPHAFAGRDSEVARLTALLDDDPQAAPEAVVITAIDGMAGVGKTALAVHAGHRLAQRFPAGQVFINLHGYTTGVAPVEAADALERLLRAQGVPGERIPAEVEDRAALWRTLLADRRMLVVLDNAATEAQVQPLLPGTPGCLVLVTSRRRLTGLRAAHTVSLDVLSESDAVTLFTRTVGRQRLADEPTDLVAQAVALCGRLPLAIQIAGGRFRSRPTWNLTELVTRLRDQEERLIELADELGGVAAALDLSFHQLEPEQQRLYRLLAQHPGADIEPYAAAALAGTTVARVRRLLDALVDVNVLQEHAAGRYLFHDLVRAHALNADGDSCRPHRRPAMGRLLDHYRHAAAAAMGLAYPYERARRPPVPPAGGQPPELPDAKAAIDWLDLELPNLLAAARHAAEDGWPGHAHHLPATLHRHLQLRGRQREAAQIHEVAIRNARAEGDRDAELISLTQLSEVHRVRGDYGRALEYCRRALALAAAVEHPAGKLNALLDLGHLDLRHGRYAAAADHYRRARELTGVVGPHPGEAEALLGLGHVDWLQERTGQSADHYTAAMDRARAVGHRAAELDALLGLGRVQLLQERIAEATEHFGRALEIARDLGAPSAEMNAMASLGHAHRRQGKLDQAGDHYQRALELARAIGHRAGETNALVALGNVHRLTERYEQAAACCQDALTFAEQVDNRNWQFEAVQGLGRLHLATGQPRTALAYHRRALELATDLGHPRDQARAHDGLALAQLALDQPAVARHHWRQALDILTQLKIEYTEDEETNVATIRLRLGHERH